MSLRDVDKTFTVLMPRVIFRGAGHEHRQGNHQDHGGKVSVNSEPVMGTAVTILLPLFAVAEA